MYKILPVLLLFAPLLIQAQTAVKPVVSADYISLINNDSVAIAQHKGPDSSRLYLRQPYSDRSPVRSIRIKQGGLIIDPVKTKWLSIGGNYTFSAAARSVNSTPALQDQYVQGESSNGYPVWRGPETNEIFSYGPSIQQLEYDGSAYPYDVNGKLTPIGTGNGKRASAYHNDIFRTGTMISQSITLLAAIKRNYYYPLWNFSIKAGNSIENTIIPVNRNTSHSISTSIERHLQKFSLAGSYSYFSSRVSNDNTNGFLNRVYQDALQTPVSFSNAQGATLATGAQRAYSSQADNPWFLLKNNGHFADRSQQTGNLSFEKKQGSLTFGLANTIDAVHDNSNRSLPPGAAFFPAGLVYTREQNADHYSSNAWLRYNIRYYNSQFSSIAKMTYIYQRENVKIDYPSDTYSYHRSSNDAAFTFNTTYNDYYEDVTGGLNIGNKFYTSNTSLHNKFFLPEISGFISRRNLFDDGLFAKLAATYSVFCSEPSIDHTLSSFMLTQLMPQQARQFTPFAEVRTFNGLAPMQHREFTSKLELDLNYIINFYADLSIRNTSGNIFPAYENDQLIVKNMADTRYNGLELRLRVNSGRSNYQKFHTSHTILFYKYSNIVTRVQNGYDYHPMAGFANIYKALVKGQPVGVIVEAGSQPSIIGDPTPDYTLKFSHAVVWRAFSINLDWEYRKGGKVWNGTAAVLDYYGRSENSAAARKTPGYIADRLGEGYTGIAQAYIERGDNIRINTLALAYDIGIKKYVKNIKLTASVQNLILWSAYKGGDPNQLLYDQPGSTGLDFFNLPSTKNFGAGVSIQF